MIHLNNFYTTEGFYTDNNNDGLFDGIKGKIYIRENASISEKLTALNLLARLSYESTAMSKNNIELSALGTNPPNNSIIISVDKNALLEDDETQLTAENDSLKVISKTENALKVNGRYLYGRMPYIWRVGKEEPRLEDFLKKLEDIGLRDISADKITLSSKYEGIKSLYISGKMDSLNDSFTAQAEEILKNYKIKKLTINVNNSELTVENKVFDEAMHLSNDAVMMSKAEEGQSSEDKAIDLADLFSVNGIYTDSENDLMNNRLDIKIAVDDNISDNMVKAVGNIAVRTALDCLELKLDLVQIKSDAGSGKRIEIIETRQPTAKIYINEKSGNIIIEGNEAAMLSLSESMAEQYPFIDADKSIQIKDLRDLLDSILRGKNYQGQLVHLEEALENAASAGEITLYANLSGQERTEEAKNKISQKYPDKKFEIFNHKKEEIVWTECYEPEWEVDTFENIFKNEVYPLLKSGDEVVIKGCLSEEKSVRDDLTDRLRGYIEKSGAVLKSANIFSTYKQGFSWITEKVIPELKSTQIPDKILIKFKPFLPEGTTEWFDENGSQPTTNVKLEDDENRWFDLPIRFLQELYPVDDIIAAELNIDRNAIEFKDDDSLTDTYEIICYKNEKEIYKDTGVTRISERPYLDEFPELGKVHPTTGWITVYVNDKKAADKQIKTDLENIWDFYQKTALNKAKSYILEKGEGKLLLDKQPFFTELRIEADISDIDYKLPTRMDLISSLDALHEDMYFVGSDFFKYLGIKMSGASAAEPGLILPVLRKRIGKGPRVVATIKKELYDEPKLFVKGFDNYLQKNCAGNVKIDSIEYNDNGVTVNIKADNKSFGLLSKYVELVNEKSIKDITDESIMTVSIENESTGQKAVINKSKTKIKKLKKPLDESKINTDSLIGYDDYIALVEELKDVKHLKTYAAAKSYQGRDVYTIELFDEELNDIVSKAKLINYKPVCFINSRHHANEISSTNAAFDLIKHLLKDESYKHYLEKLNIVIIPFENPDGGYIHYELQKDNPEWKFHVARFNALGKETTSEQFNMETKHTETLAFTRTWYKWLPDVVTDNHGVPSHEWDQQFSGYVSPSFKGFWLPRALYYGIFWYMTDEEYTENNVGVCKIIQDKLSDLVNADEEMTKWNFDWADRFEKYAHAWLPKMFPADYYKNLIYYWVPFDTKKVKKYSSHRYPNITCLDWTTEVSDETATGDYLKLCARTHLKGCLAAMDSVISVNNKADILDYEEKGQIVLNKKRKRPLSL